MRLSIIATVFFISAIAPLRGQDVERHAPATRPARPVLSTNEILDRELTELPLEGVALSDTIDFIRDLTGLNIYVDWPGLEEVKLERNTPVTYKAKNIKIAAALAGVLSAVGGEKATYTIIGDVVVISSPEGAAKIAKTFDGLLPVDWDKGIPEHIPRKLPEVPLEGVALVDVVDFYRDVMGASFAIDWAALEAAGIDRNAPVTLHLKNVSTAAAINFVLISIGGKNKLAAKVEHGVIAISTKEHLPDFAAKNLKGFRDTKPATRPAESDRQFHEGLDRTLPEMKFDAVALGDLIDFFRDATGTNIYVDWNRLVDVKLSPATPIMYHVKNVKTSRFLQGVVAATGQEKVVYQVVGGVAVISTKEGAAALAKSFERGAAWDDAFRKQMDRPFPEIPFNGVALSDVIDFYRDVTGMSFSVDWKRLEDAGIDRNAPVTINLKNMTTGAAILFSLASADVKGAALGFDLGNGVILISTKEGLDANAIWMKAADPTTWDKSIAEAYGKRLPNVSFKSTPLVNIIDFLEMAGGVRIDVEWDKFTRDKAEPATRIDLEAQNLSIHEILERAFTTTEPLPLRVTVRNGHLFVTTTVKGFEE